MEKNLKIKVGDKLLFSYPTSESLLVVSEQDGELGVIDYPNQFVPLSECDLENATIISDEQ